MFSNKEKTDVTVALFDIGRPDGHALQKRCRSTRKRPELPARRMSGTRFFYLEKCLFFICARTLAV